MISSIPTMRLRVEGLGSRLYESFPSMGMGRARASSSGIIVFVLYGFFPQRTKPSREMGTKQLLFQHGRRTSKVLPVIR